MRTFKNLFIIAKYQVEIEEYLIGYTRIYIYQNLDKDEEVFFSKRIKLLFQLAMHTDFILLWFDKEAEMYIDLNEFLEVNAELYLKFIVIID